MKSLRSASANLGRLRFFPRPTSTQRSAPEATWPSSVLMEQFSLAAACAAVLSPSGEDWRSLRAARSRRLNASPSRYASRYALKHSGQLPSSQQNPASLPSGKRSSPGEFFCDMKGWVIDALLRRPDQAPTRCSTAAGRGAHCHPTSAFCGHRSSSSIISRSRIIRRS